MPSFKANNNVSRPAFPQSQPPYATQQPAMNIQRTPSIGQRSAYKVNGRYFWIAFLNYSTFAAQPHQNSVNNDYSAPSNYESANDYRQEEEEEGGFYDNIQNLNAREEQHRQSLPTMGQHAGARFGQPMLIQPVPPQPPPHKFLAQQKGNPLMTRLAKKPILVLQPISLEFRCANALLKQNELQNQN